MNEKVVCAHNTDTYHYFILLTGTTAIHGTTKPIRQLSRGVLH